jgi:DnaJ like chaperone protein
MKPHHYLMGAVAGWAMGGPLGAFLMSFGLIQVTNYLKSTKSEKKKFTSTYGDLALAILVLFRWVAMVDRKLQKQEEQFVKEFLFKEFGTDAVEMGIKTFNEIKQGPIRPIINDISKQIKNNTNLEERIILIDALFRLANADGVITEKEELRVYNISKIIELPESEYRRLKAMYVFERKQSQQKTYARTRKARLSNAYQILGVDASCTETELKKAFRTLAKEHHPDKFAHISKQAATLAEERFEKILAAYELIKAKRAYN